MFRKVSTGLALTLGALTLPLAFSTSAFGLSCAEVDASTHAKDADVVVKATLYDVTESEGNWNPKEPSTPNRVNYGKLGVTEVYKGEAAPEISIMSDGSWGDSLTPTDEEYFYFLNIRDGRYWQENCTFPQAATEENLKLLTAAGLKASDPNGKLGTHPEDGSKQATVTPTMETDHEAMIRETFIFYGVLAGAALALAGLTVWVVRRARS